MFKKLATAKNSNRAADLVKLHPAELIALLEQAWNIRMHNRNLTEVGHPERRSNTPGVSVPVTFPVVSSPPSVAGGASSPGASFTAILAEPPSEVPGGWGWPHLIYAYMIENTRIYEIFRRVIHEFLHGEKLGAPLDDTLLWLRNTEELFYRDPPPLSIAAVSSHVRPDLRATRRNAYQRMFGMDLNHGADDNSPYPYVRAEVANNEFVPTFEELLREVWVGHINLGNQSGVKPTDDTKLQELARKLRNMLTTRRQGGNLSREEFYFVAMMSWFHLTVDNNLPIIQDLRATATSPEQRLFRIAQVVGLPAHGLSRSYFEIAEDLSAVLITIETGALDASPAAAKAFYDPAVSNSLAGVMTRIIMHWSLITGRDIKAGKMAPS